MPSQLMREFLAQECTPAVRELLRAALSHPRPGKAAESFQFNRFDVTIDFENGTVLLEDDLNASHDGSAVLPLGEFLNSIQSQPEQPT